MYSSADTRGCHWIWSLASSIHSPSSGSTYPPRYISSHPLDLPSASVQEISPYKNYERLNTLAAVRLFGSKTRYLWPRFADQSLRVLHYPNAGRKTRPDDAVPEEPGTHSYECFSMYTMAGGQTLPPPPGSPSMRDERGPSTRHLCTSLFTHLFIRTTFRTNVQPMNSVCGIFIRKKPPRIQHNTSGCYTHYTLDQPFTTYGTRTT